MSRGQYIRSIPYESISKWEYSVWFRISLIVILGLGIFFRVWGLGGKIYSHDEAYTSMSAAGYQGGEVFNAIWDGEPKTADDIRAFVEPNQARGVGYTISWYALYGPQEAPLFFVLAHYWMRIVGYLPAAMRGLAALFGLLSIPVFYWFCIELFGSSRTALLATAIFALSPYQVLFSQEARSYSLWTLATIFSSAALLWAIQKETISAWTIYSCALILGLYSHQLFIFVIIVHILYFVGQFALRRTRKFIGFLSAFLFALLAYTPWLYFVITRWKYASTLLDWAKMVAPGYRYIQRWALIFSSPFMDLDFGNFNWLPYLLRALILIGTVYALIGFIRRASSSEIMFLLLLYVITAGPLIGSDMLLGGVRSLNGRYFVPASIAAILLMAYFLSSKLDQVRSQRKWKILTSLLFMAALISNMNSLLSETWWNKELGRVTPAFVQIVNKGESLLIVSGHHPTNLGDVLLLSLEVDEDTRFELSEDPNSLEYGGDFQNIYWFPSSLEEVDHIRKAKGLDIEEVLPGTLWRIDSIVQ